MYPAIMGWFLTLTSKMTGLRIPGATSHSSSSCSVAGLAPGGRYQLHSQQVDLCLVSMETVANAMAEKSHWKWPQVRLATSLPQYAILNMMHHDLEVMIDHFRDL